MPPKKVKRKTAKKKRVRHGREPIPRYNMPRSKMAFRLDAEIGRHLMDNPDAMTKVEILRHFGISERKFNARAKIITPLLSWSERQQVMSLLFEMGKERPGDKKK